MPTVSVIVPVYNVEKYIHRCVDSILGQTFSDLELILVDDGSPDNCPSICDEYAAKDNRVRVIHQENSGLSAARNAGLDVMAGEFVSFVDSDDWLEDSFLEVMLKHIWNEESDIAMCGVRKVWQENVADCKLAEESTCLSRTCAISLLAHTDWYYFVVWNKLYRRKVFENICFPEGFLHEDEFIIHMLYDRCARVSVIDGVLYNYRQTPDSIMGRDFRIQRTDKLSALAERIVFSAERKWVDVCNFTCRKYVLYFFDYYFRYKQTSENEPYFRRMNASLAKAFPFILWTSGVTIGQKLKLWAILWRSSMIKANGR